jgi:hypothetical protein
MGKVPAVEAVPVAVSCVEEMNVVVRAVLLKRTSAPLMKFVPERVREKLPRLAAAGEMPVRAGVGFQRVTAEEEDFVVSAALVAVTVMVLGEGRVEGAE